jgi:hypothetical protein
LKSRIQDSGFRIQEGKAGCRMLVSLRTASMSEKQESGIRIQDSGFRIQDSGKCRA